MSKLSLLPSERGLLKKDIYAVFGDQFFLYRVDTSEGRRCTRKQARNSQKNVPLVKTTGKSYKCIRPT